MIATYRVQLTPELGFDAVAKLVPYFVKLGISHLYLSPITESRKGSQHGYDVIDHNRVREELGGIAGFHRLREAAKTAGLKLILDVVPNHAGVGVRNVAWQDVLAYGPSSFYARTFDIEWRPLKPELREKLLLPFLGVTYGEALDQGQITLINRDGRIYAQYFDSAFALSPASYAPILAAALPKHERTEEYWDLKDLWEAYRTLQPGEREKAEALRPRLIALAQRIDLNAILAGIQGQTLHEILEQQFWRLSFWKTAGYEINYRRFFDINELVALRMEDAEVFWDAHRLIGELLAQDGVEGLRIDHVDGLADPRGYLWRLRDLGANQIWVEKILAFDETMPADWPVQGTTGYEFMADVVRVLIPPHAEKELDRAYENAIGPVAPYKDQVCRSKRLVMATSLTGELSRLAYQLDRLSESDYHSRDFTLEALREALTEIVSAFPRYRTYLPEERVESERVIKQAIREAMERNALWERTVYEFIERMLLGPVPPVLEEPRAEWVRRFQQYTAPLAAKGVEDTVFYRYHRLAALNDVGAEPDIVCISADQFHQRAMQRGERFPRTLLATATHDHKRGEDTRMRLIVLAELGERWVEMDRKITALGDRHVTGDYPSRNDRYLFRQLLVALWGGEDLVERLVAYTQKAAHEAKVHTSWLHPNEAYDKALEKYVRGLLGDPDLPQILEPFATEVARHGFSNTLSQLLLKMTVPGVPDFYIGVELLDLSLVDPDNRRAISMEERDRLLDEMKPMIESPDAAQLKHWIEARDPRAKVYFTAKVLAFRRANAEAFAAKYVPLEVRGARKEHLIAFARLGANCSVAVLVPRFPATLQSWDDTEVVLPAQLAEKGIKEVLSGAAIGPSATVKISDLPQPWAILTV